LKADGADIAATRNAQARQAIVQDLVFVNVAKRYANEKGYGAPSVDYATAAQQSGLPANNPYLRTHTEASAYLQLLLKNVRSVTPTEADYREIYQGLVQQGVTGTYDQVKPDLQQITDIGPALGLRQELADPIKRYNVQVNPVYGGTSFPLASVTVNNQQGQRVALTLVTLPLTGTAASPAVVDAR
jgi:hypothetical protein